MSDEGEKILCPCGGQRATYESRLYLHNVGFRDGTQVVKLGGKHLCPPSHLSSQVLFLFETGPYLKLTSNYVAEELLSSDPSTFTFHVPGLQACATTQLELTFNEPTPNDQVLLAGRGA